MFQKPTESRDVLYEGKREFKKLLTFYSLFGLKTFRFVHISKKNPRLLTTESLSFQILFRVREGTRGGSLTDDFFFQQSFYTRSTVVPVLVPDLDLPGSRTWSISHRWTRAGEWAAV